MAFKLVIKHYKSGARRFFREDPTGTRRISGSAFDVLVEAPLCRGVAVKEA